MKPVALATLFLALGGLALATVPAAGRLERLQEDRLVIEALVDSGLRLAAEDSPLKRAQICTVLADQLAHEVKQAATGKQGARAADLGRHLQSLLERGVASNLSLAQRRLPADSPLIPEMERLGQEAVNVITPVMRDLESSSAREGADMRAAAQGLSRARAEVERVSRGQPKRPVSPKD